MNLTARAADRVCAIHQPNFFPRLSTLGKIASSDCWVILDNVQFTRRDYQHRAKLLPEHADHDPSWLILPVHLPHGRATHINQARIVEPKQCQRRITATLTHRFRRAAHWPQLRRLLTPTLELLNDTDDLALITETTTRTMLELLGWNGTILHASTLPARPHKSQRLADLTRAAECHTYQYGTGGARYLDLAPFDATGLRAQPYELPELHDQLPHPPASGARNISALNHFAYMPARVLAERLIL